MRKRELYVVLISLIMLAGCSGQQNAAKDLEMAPPAGEPNLDPSAGEQELVEPTKAAETAGPNCLGDEINQIGQSIADEYPSASYEQVMTWFCNGAAFEDILVALETEAQTDTSAEEMLQLLVEGFSWEEIWGETGLTN